MKLIARQCHRITIALLTMALMTFGAAPLAAADNTVRDDLIAFSQASAAGNTAQAAALATRLSQADLGVIASYLSPLEIAELRASLAEALAENNQYSDAIGMLTQIIADDERAIAAMPVREAAAWRAGQLDRLRLLATLQQQGGQPKAAVATLQQALAVSEQIMESEDPALRFILADLIAAQKAAGLSSPTSLGNRLADLNAAAEAAGLISLGGGSVPLDTEEYQTVRVFYGTTRLDTYRQDPAKAYSKKRNRNAGQPTFGSVVVTVPKNREIGAIPRPGFGHLGGPKDGVHIVIKRVDRAASHTAFRSMLGRSLLQDDGTKRDAFVFVHGHATDFAKAARRTAQLAVDLDMRRGGIFYAWPSSHGVQDYQRSQNNVSYAAEGLATLLKTAAAEADELHIIAHSMGNRVLLASLEELREDGFLGPDAPFDQIIWASPDVDSFVFAKGVAKVATAAKGMTLYVSAKDRALSIAKWLGGDDPRAGQAPPPPAIAGLMHTVDTTLVAGQGQDRNNHGDYVGGALVDMRAVMWHRLPPDRRCTLQPSDQNEKTYWVLSTAGQTCAAEDFRRATSALRLFGANAVAQVNALVAQLEQTNAEELAEWQRALGILEDF